MINFDQMNEWTHIDFELFFNTDIDCPKIGQGLILGVSAMLENGSAIYMRILNVLFT